MLATLRMIKVRLQLWSKFNKLNFFLFVVTEELSTSAVHHFLETVTPQFRDIDTKKDDRIAWYAQQGCRCELGRNKTPCCQNFPEAYYREMRGYWFELKKEERDVALRADTRRQRGNVQ